MKWFHAKVARRPSYPPEVMFKILFLEFYYNLSDVEVVKQLRFNVLFRYFSGIKIEDPLPDDTSLVIFRKRLGEERFDRIFDKFVEQCKEKGLSKERLTRLLEKVAHPERKRKLVSFVDPEARFGTRFAGYKAHIAKDESQDHHQLSRPFPEMKMKERRAT